MKKLLVIAKKIILIIIVILIGIWVTSLLKCEILTALHGDEFETIYRENTMMGDIDYLKILQYSDSKAEVYYVSANKAAGDILSFTKQNNQWKYNGEWKTIWSSAGSASSVIYPYWWHFVYGGL
jgi:hypothetical protein